MANNHVAQDRAKIEAAAPKWPCLCICGCGRRHWNIETELCLLCLEQSRENPLRHGER